MTIAAVLRDKGGAIETVTADTSVYDAVRRLGEKRIGALPVVENGRIAGIISERDVIYRLRDHGPEMLDWPVSRVMSAPAITTSSDTEVLAALALMTQRRIRHPRWKPTDGSVRKFAVNVLSAWEFRPAPDTQSLSVQRVERVVNLDDFRTMGIMFWARLASAKPISASRSRRLRFKPALAHTS